MNQISQYLVDLCVAQHLSFRRASLLAGLAPETIGKIVNREDSRPRPDTLRRIADALHGDYEVMMRLAGHLPSGPVGTGDDGGEIGPGERAALDEIIRLWVQIKDTDPESLHRLINMARMQAELVAAALRVREREEQEQQADEIVTE